MGVVFAVPVGVGLLFSSGSLKTRVIRLGFFIAPIVLLGSFWLLQILAQWELFLLQNQLQLHRKAFSDPYVFLVFTNLPLQRFLLCMYWLSSILYLYRWWYSPRKWSSKSVLLSVFIFFTPLMSVWMKEMWYLVYSSFSGVLAVLLNIEWCHRKQVGRCQVIQVLLVCAVAIVQVMIFFNFIEQTTVTKMEYEAFGEQVATYIPPGSTVLLSSFPNAYFYLVEHRPDLVLREPPNSPFPEPIDPEVFNKVLNQIEYVVLSHLLSDYQQQYFRVNLETVVYESNYPDEYLYQIIKLKPPEDRVPISPPAEKTWKYPVVAGYE